MRFFKRQYEIALMKVFQTMLQHRTILLLKHVFPYLHPEIGIDSQDIIIKCRMMNFTKRDAVLNDGISQW